MAQTDPALPASQSPPQRRRKRGWFLLCVGVFNALWSLLVLLVLIAVAAVYFLYDRPIDLPDWAEAQIEARLEEEFPQVRVTFGEMRLLMEEGWRPRVRLRDVSVSTAEGRELIRLSEARARLSMPDLRRGQVKAAEVIVTGVFSTLIRETDGTISIMSDLSGTPRNLSIDKPGDIVTRLDEILQQPGLAALERAELHGMTLQFVDRRAGQAFTVDGGRLIAQREDGALVVNADLAVLGSANAATTLSANYNSVVGETTAEFGVQIKDAQAGDIASQSPAFGWLGTLRAPLSGAVRSGVREDGTLAPVNATLQIGAGALQPNDGTQPIPFDAARSYFTYDAARELLQFDELSVQSKWITAHAEGTASLAGLRGGDLEALVGQFRVTQLRADPMDFYPEPIELEGAEIDFLLKIAPFQLDIGRLDVFDQGLTHHAKGVLSARPEGWELALDAHTDTITPERIVALWPEAVKPKTRVWLHDNLFEADISNADFALRLAPDSPPDSYLAFDFQDASARVMRNLPPVSGARGHGTIKGKKVVISVDRAQMEAAEGGTLEIERSAFIIPDTSIKPGTPAIVELNAQGPLHAALWVLDQPPMAVMSRSNLPVDLGQGRVSASGTLAFPLRKGGKPSDVKFDVAGDLRGLDSTTLIKGRRLRSPRMALVASNTNLTLSGSGTLEGVPFDATWKQPIGAGSDKSKITGTAQIAPDALQAFNVNLPSGMLQGRAQASFDIALQRGQAPRMTLRSGLRGAALQIPQLGWRKGTNEAGALEMDIRLGNSPAVTAMTLSGAGLEAQGAISLAQGGGLDTVELNRLRLGGWLDVRAALVGQGAGRAPQVVVRGGTLDLQRATFGGAGGAGRAGANASNAAAPPMRVVLDRLQITDKIWLQGLAGSFKTTGGIDGAFEARVNGQTGVSGRVIPQGGRTAVRLTSTNAGGVLRSAGLLQQAHGGTLDLSLLPVGSGGAYDGKLDIKDVSVKDAPSVAALVNAVSVVGLINEMNGDGIYFDDVEADFRLTPGRITVSNGSAVGKSLGVTIDGVFATDTGQLSMQGVVTPVYLLNGIGSVFTRKGEGLFGLTFALTGSTKSPQVAVNPLSVLAPGGLRNIFRGPQTELPRVEGEPEPAPEPKKERRVEQDRRQR
ncbi:MAG: DUF3971 domain-containing protein [Sulfitobacter sp.]